MIINCYKCNKILREEESTCVGLGMKLCKSCYRLGQKAIMKRMLKDKKEDAKHKFVIKFAGQIIKCDDRDNDYD
jgi:late competence protein required for DNA uptake (superfamily II DNA/RNA helicase)